MEFHDPLEVLYPLLWTIDAVAEPSRTGGVPRPPMKGFVGPCQWTTEKLVVCHETHGNVTRYVEGQHSWSATSARGVPILFSS